MKKVRHHTFSYLKIPKKAMIIYAFTTKFHKKRGQKGKSMSKSLFWVGALPRDVCFLRQIIGYVQII